MYLCPSSVSFQQVKRGVGMTTKVWHLTGAAVVMVAKKGTNEQEVQRSWRGSDTTEGSSGEGPAGNKRAEERKVMIVISALLCLHLPLFYFILFTNIAFILFWFFSTSNRLVHKLILLKGCDILSASYDSSRKPKVGFHFKKYILDIYILEYKQ